MVTGLDRQIKKNNVLIGTGVCIPQQKEQQKLHLSGNCHSMGIIQLMQLKMQH